MQTGDPFSVGRYLEMELGLDDPNTSSVIARHRSTSLDWHFCIVVRRPLPHCKSEQPPHFLVPKPSDRCCPLVSELLGGGGILELLLAKAQAQRHGAMLPEPAGKGGEWNGEEKGGE
jgi:hypothetical protein